MTAALVPTDRGFCVHGSISVNTVYDLRLQGEKELLRCFQSSQSVEIDLSKIEDQDASVFSLLLCWMRFAKNRFHDRQLHFVNMSPTLQRMGKMFGLLAIWTN